MQRVKIPLKELTAIAVCGAVGGGVNALLCFARIPVAVADNPSFHWVVVPGGMIHGAFLVLIPFVAALAVKRRPPRLKLVLAPIIGWVAGYLSWIPLCRWAYGETWAESLIWPFRTLSFDTIWWPYCYFGLVSMIYFLCLAQEAAGRHVKRHVVCGVCSGVLGSLWWWILWQPWYFALIHGSIWGILVGLASDMAEQVPLPAKRYGNCTQIGGETAPFFQTGSNRKQKTLSVFDKQRQKIESLVCPYCKEHFFFFSSVVRCGKCRSYFHDICWEANKICGVFGCTSTVTLEQHKEWRNYMLSGWTILSLVLAGITLMVLFPMPHDAFKKGTQTLIVGANLFFWGLLFLHSYFFPDSSFVSRGLLWFTENISFEKRSAKHALFYAVILMFLGIVAMLDGLGFTGFE